LASRKLTAYVAAVGAASLIPLALAVVSLSTDLRMSFFSLLAIGIACEIFRVALSNSSQLSLTFVVIIAAMALEGTDAAVAIAALASITACLYPKPAPANKVIFNVGAAVVTTAAASELYIALTQLMGLPLRPEVSLAIMAPLSAAALFHFLFNTGMVALAISFAERVPAHKVWRQNFQWVSVNYLLLAPIGLALAIAYLHLGVFGLITFFAPLAMARYSFSLYLDRTREVRERNRELRDYADALQQTNSSLDQKVKELSALHDVASAIGSSVGLEKTFQLILELSAKLLNFKAGFLLIRDQKTQQFVLEGTHGLDPDQIELGVLQSFVSRAVESRAPVLVSSSGDLADEIAFALLQRWGTGARSLLFVPVVFDGQSLGVIGLACNQPSEEDIQVMSIFAMQAALAIVNAQRYRLTERMAITDSLTGLYNYRYFRERLQTEFLRAQRERADLSLLVLDIDFFKKVNDTYGHQFGDDVLRGLSRALKDIVRLGDDIFRIGGEEFAILLPHSGRELADEVAERIRLSVKHHFNDFQDRLPELTVSIGIGTYPADTRNLEELLSFADAALYQAKRSGRNICRHHSPDYLETARSGRPSEDQEAGDPVPASLVDDYGDTVQVLSAMIDAKDNYAPGHSERVAEYSVRLAEHLELEDSEKEAVRLAAMLHDVGKVGIPDEVLNKEGRLSDDEFDQVKRHPVIGARVLRRFKAFKLVVPMVLHHREHFDGTGYPAGLSGSAIPLGARLIAVIDAFEAMMSPRPYRQSLGLSRTLDELRSNAGTQFDPQIVSLFFEIVHQNGDTRRQSWQRRLLKVVGE